jgi:hypothetical protein
VAADFLLGIYKKEFTGFWSLVRYDPGFRKVVNENIFYSKKNKPSNIHIVWKIPIKSHTTLVCRGFGHFFTFSGLLFGRFFWKFQYLFVRIFSPVMQTIFRKFATGKLPNEKISLFTAHRAKKQAAKVLCGPHRSR